MPKPIAPPKLVNRGAAGLLTSLKKGPDTDKKASPAIDPGGPELWARAPKDRFTEDLEKLPLIGIPLLVSDPNNARLHPEKNMESIKDSLARYGQQKPIVVVPLEDGRYKVMAGNGTTQAARELGWTKLAVNRSGLGEVEAAGFGIADNRTAELARWDFEVLARLDKLMGEAGHGQTGWTSDELEVLRTTDWTDVVDEMEAAVESPEDETYHEGDAELLERLKVTIDDPETKVKHGEVYTLGMHTLVVADAIRDVVLWKGYLLPGVLFSPYPGPLVPLSRVAQDTPVLMVQPDHYVCGHIIDHYKAVHGDKGVQLAEAK